MLLAPMIDTHMGPCFNEVDADSLSMSESRVGLRRIDRRVTGTPCPLANLATCRDGQGSVISSMFFSYLYT